MFALSRRALVELALLLLAASGIFLASKRLLWSAAPDVEVVLSTYREDPTLVSQQITLLRRVLAMHGWSSRVIVYSKDESLLLDQMDPMLKVLGADAIVSLPNRGREGGTYLNHILSHYDNSWGYYRRSPSRHVLFAQSLLENTNLLHSRISALRKSTAFMSLGPYASCDCGRDAHGQKRYFPRMREVYSMFTGELCPGGGQLCTYKGQFIVSRRQILSHPKKRYQHLLEILEAPKGHWIYDDPEDYHWEYKGQKSSPSSPFFGHVLERSWPTIFRCTDPGIADNCSSHNPHSCQCLHK
ncbi:hypothetical protein PILCRDRAFT_821385 [Piloderma croceum F 1598]|uniref:Uncharacterized protein n=1 Tax=Piloderma croceum (strain F 1598) TaxID=765440 RepID=A0A0C3B5X6_PILCF|nr:hypothetical protein PILCRDRAFT_821385 [Piloderma croceum F 1598]